MSAQIKKLMKNRWQPLPIVITETEYETRLKIIDDLNYGTLRLIFENDPILVKGKNYILDYSINLKEKINSDYHIRESVVQQVHNVGKMKIKPLDRKEAIFSLKKKKYTKYIYIYIYLLGLAALYLGQIHQ